MSLTLDDIWNLVEIGQVSKAHEVIQAMCSERGLQRALPVSEQFHQAVAALHSSDDAVSFMILEPTLARMAGRATESERVLRDIQEFLEKKKFRPHALLLFQRGMSFFDCGDFGQALDLFTAAKRIAKNPQDIGRISLAIIEVMDRRGEDYGESIESFLKEFRSYEKKNWAAPLFQRIWVLLAQRYFRKGDYRRLQGLILDYPEGMEFRSFVGWLLRLPHSKFAAPSTRNLLHEMTGYSGRTNQFFMTEDDLEHPGRPSELVERFYGWTWQWLMEPTSAGAERLSRIRGQINQIPWSQLSPESQLMVENANRWCGLFAGLPAKKVDMGIAGGMLKTPLGYEKIFIDAMFGKRDGETLSAQDALVYLGTFQLPEEFRLMQLTEKWSANEGKFAMGLWGLANPPTPSLADGVIVDVLSQRISVTRDGAETNLRSGTLVRLLLGLAKFQMSKPQELWKVCAGVGLHRAEFQPRKFSQMIDRMNELCSPFVSARVTGLRVEFNQDPTKLHFHYSVPQTLACTMAPRLEEVLGRSVPVSQDSPEVVVDAVWITRRDMEQLLGSSRATVVRRLNEWVSKGLLSRKGSGKATRYKLTEELRHILKNQSE